MCPIGSRRGITECAGVPVQTHLLPLGLLVHMVQVFLVELNKVLVIHSGLVLLLLLVDLNVV